MAENGILDYQGMNQAIYRGATSNIVVDTQSMSIEIGAGNSSHTSNLHIECDHDANVASIQLNSNVVTEFSRSKKLIKYPRVALTSAAATSPGYQEYIATASSSWSNSINYDAWAAFNGNVEEGTQEGWISIGGSYDNATPSLPVTTGINAEFFNSRYGDWLNIKLPHKIVLSKLHTYPRTGNENPGVVRPNEHPDAGYLYGSNDGFSTFQEIYSFDGVPVSTTFMVPTIHTINATKAYNEYRFQVTKLKGQKTATTISEMELYGTPEYDPEAHGTDVTVKSYPNVPNTDWLEVYYDAKGLATGAVTTVNDLKPSSLGSAINSSSVTDVSVSNEAFAFNGSSSGINATLSNPQGAWAHSTSVWIKLGKDHSAYSSDNVFCIGSVAGTAQLESLRIHPNEVRFVTFQSGADAIYSLPMDRDRWYHFTLTYDGGAGQNSLRLFRDGIEYTGTTTAAPVALSLAGNSLLSIGYERVRNQKYFNGSIANFRIFNRALTSDEIYQLYAYQKEYFGHGDLSMTLKAGRLGIGTSEPRAALDVRGTINATRFNTLVAEHTVTSTVDSVEINGLDLIGDGGTYKILWKVRNYGATNPQYYMTVNGDATTGNYYYGGKQHTNAQSLHNGNYPTIFKAGQDSTHTLEITMTRSCDGYIVAHGQGTFHTGNNMNHGAVQGWELNRWFYKIPGNVTSILFSSANPDTARYGSGSNIQIHKYM